MSFTYSLAIWDLIVAKEYRQIEIWKHWNGDVKNLTESNQIKVFTIRYIIGWNKIVILQWMIMRVVLDWLAWWREPCVAVRLISGSYIRGCKDCGLSQLVGLLQTQCFTIYHLCSLTGFSQLLIVSLFVENWLMHPVFRMLWSRSYEILFWFCFLYHFLLTVSVHISEEN